MSNQARSFAHQVNDLAEIAREIDSFTKVGLRVPAPVWEKYDRVNKRHKKHEDMLAIAAGARSNATRKRRAREDEKQGRHQSCDEQQGTHKPNQERETSSSSSSCSRGHQPSAKQGSSLPSSAQNSSPPVASPNKPKQCIAAAPFQGGRCTFGTRLGKDEDDAMETLARRAKHAPMAFSGSDPPSAWGQQERDKLNEICECNCSRRRRCFWRCLFQTQI